MKPRRDYTWLIAIVGLIAGLLIGVWAGARWAPSLIGVSYSDLNAQQQDDFVALVALGYSQTKDLDQTKTQLQALQAPNLGQLVSGVAERRINNNGRSEEITALAQLALALGVVSPALEQRLPTPTSLPTPTAIAVAPSPTPLPATPAPPAATPTVEPATATPTASATTETPTAAPVPAVIAVADVNIRSGPGLDYDVVFTLTTGDKAPITGTDSTGQWWQVQLEDGSTGWVLGQLVSTEGAVEGVTIVANVAPPPATPTRPLPASTPVRPTALPPTAEPTKPSTAFRLVERRLWGVEENGGHFDGDSLNCGGGQVLHVYVRDVAGNPLNGVAVVAWNHSITNERVTGNKGVPGMAEIESSEFYNIRVARDENGAATTSETTTVSKVASDIPEEFLIAGGYCKDSVSCQHHREQSCRSHYSWDVTFQRTS